MISPHGSQRLNPLYVSDADENQRLIEAAASMPNALLSSAGAANAVMLGAGYFNPLTGYMNKADAMRVAEEMHTSDGLFWPTPVLCLVENATGLSTGEPVALLDPNVEGNPVIAVLHLTAIETLDDADMAKISEKVYGVTDNEHPGVKEFYDQGRTLLSGDVQVLNFSYFQSEFADTFRTAVEIRQAIAGNGWDKVVAFQTRNPMHLAHEELCRIAMERVGADGCVIHMLLGKLKPGDIPADVRNAAIRKMVEIYFPANTVMITGYGFDMLYAGPREAVLARDIPPEHGGHAFNRRPGSRGRWRLLWRLRCADDFR